jgi:nucleoid-associated protein YgaU
MNLKQTLPLAAAVLTLAISTGCAKRQQQEPVATPTPAQLESSFQNQQLTPTPVPPLPTPVPTPKRNSYIVRKGDTLWAIAGDASVQGDNFRWPLLFKANRDQIIDPDLIEPAQDLTWKENYNTDEIGDAVKKAQETPPYAPHSAPRKQLPLKY